MKKKIIITLLIVLVPVAIIMFMMLTRSEGHSITTEKDSSFDKKVEGFVHPFQHTVYYREVTLLDISSSTIRELIAKGCSVRYLLPEKVEAYIYQEDLYGYSRESVEG